MQVNQPTGNFGAAAGQPQQEEMAQQLAVLGVWHDPIQQIRIYQSLAYPDLSLDAHLQM
jgi:hypothetical protein